MEKILDTSIPLDVVLFDKCVSEFYEGSVEQRKVAGDILNKFQEDINNALRVVPILESSNNMNSKFLALNVLDKLVRTRWKILSGDDKEGIRSFTIGLCLNWAGNPEGQTTKALLNKADLTLVQILKMEWPHNWPDFIPDLIQSSMLNVGVCENNMVILRLLSEELFDFNASSMTETKALALRSQLSSEFGEIFTLCHRVLEEGEQPSLVLATLNCLQRYLSWVPFNYIFETDILKLLITKFLNHDVTQNATLQCLTEVAQSQPPAQYNEILAQAFIASLEVFTLNGFNIKQLYAESNTSFQMLISSLMLYLTGFMKFHLPLLEALGDTTVLLKAHEYLLMISQVDERELFKGCLDYWSRLVKNLYHVRDQKGFERGGPYGPILSQLRTIIIEQMVKPEEVLIVEVDGEIIRESYQDSDTTTLYKSLRDVLVYLTHIDKEDTKRIMMDKLERQVNGTEWSWNNMNVLCWAIGSISGTMEVNEEKYFLSNVLTSLLSFTDRKRGKDNKAVVASNIMYIIGQYPRYLRDHWKFLRTVVYKLFEFMHESHEGVKDMACDTFITIADKCKRHFIEHKPDQPAPLIDQIINDISLHTEDLEPHQTQEFFEACGKVLSAQPEKDVLSRQLTDLMATPNQAWAQLISSGDVLFDPQNLKILVNIIKTNTATCSALGAGFITQMANISNDILNLYTGLSDLIKANAPNDPNFVNKHETRLIRSVKRELLKLLETFLSQTDQETATQIAENLIRALLDDYVTSPPNFREYEVLSCAQALVSKISGTAPQLVHQILIKVFDSTADMIRGDYLEYPDFRVEFFKLLRAINKHCFPMLLQLEDTVLASTIQACLFASTHLNRDVEEVGLSLILETVRNVSEINDTEKINNFFTKNTSLIIGDVFAVLADPDHRSGFTLQVDILALFIKIVESNIITVPLYQLGQPNSPPAGTPNNVYLHQYLCNSLQKMFTHLEPSQISQFVSSLFTSYDNRKVFSGHVRDFLIQIKEFGGDDSWLYDEDRKQQIEEQQRLQRERDLKVGGLVKPTDLEDY